MLDRFGMAVVDERRFDRRFAALEDYLRKEYGSTSGMGRYIAEANRNSSPRSGLRAFLAKVVGLVSRSPTQVTTRAVSAGGALSEERAEHATPHAPGVIAPRTRPVKYRRALKAGPRTVLPPLKR